MGNSATRSLVDTATGNIMCDSKLGNRSIMMWMITCHRDGVDLLYRLDCVPLIQWCNQVAQAFVDLEINNEELRPFLKNLHIAGAKEVVVNKSTAAIVIFIPYRLKDLFRKNQVLSHASVYLICLVFSRNMAEKFT